MEGKDSFNGLPILDYLFLKEPMPKLFELNQLAPFAIGNYTFAVTFVDRFLPHNTGRVLIDIEAADFCAEAQIVPVRTPQDLVYESGKPAII